MPELDLTNPDDLWPDDDLDEIPSTRPWVWAVMEPAERQECLQELRTWVAWLQAAHELHNKIPPCWYRHQAVVEHLTALYAGWRRTFTEEPEPGRSLIEAEWISTLHSFLPYLQVSACAAGTHDEPPRRRPPDTDRDFAQYLASVAALQRSTLPQSGPPAPPTANEPL
jgi:hypothetical protein